MSSEVGQLGHFFCWIFSPQDGETDLQAAFRAASELRNAGLKHFGDGSRFVAAQEAVETWSTKMEQNAGMRIKS